MSLTRKSNPLKEIVWHISSRFEKNRSIGFETHFIIQSILKITSLKWLICRGTDETVTRTPRHVGTLSNSAITFIAEPCARSNARVRAIPVNIHVNHVAKCTQLNIILLRERRRSASGYALSIVTCGGLKYHAYKLKGMSFAPDYHPHTYSAVVLIISRL